MTRIVSALATLLIVLVLAQPTALAQQPAPKQTESPA